MKKKDKTTRVNYLIDSEDTLIGLVIKCPYCNTELYDKVLYKGKAETHILECMCCGKKLEYIL